MSQKRLPFYKNRSFAYTLLVSILLSPYLHMVTVWLNPGFTTGKWVDSSKGRSIRSVTTYAQIVYRVGEKTYRMRGPENVKVPAEGVSIIYNQSNPEDAYIFSLLGMMNQGMLILMIWLGIVWAFYFKMVVLGHNT